MTRLQSSFAERYTPTNRELLMPALTVQEVERRMSDAKCAICKQSSFGIDQRFMQSDGEWRGVCKKCFYSFPVYTDMEFYLRTQPDVPYRLKEISCTVCNHRGCVSTSARRCRSGNPFTVSPARAANGLLPRTRRSKPSNKCVDVQDSIIE